MIQPGDAAPDFTLPRDGGGRLTLSKLYPKKVVLFFYPKDSTPACTDEAAGFSARAAAFARAGAKVVGISKDSVKRHDNFVAKNALKVPLVSDADSDVCETWGVWELKKMMGHEFMGIVRSTFLIGGDGTVLRVWSPVRVPGHVDEVLAAVKAA